MLAFRGVIWLSRIYSVFWFVWVLKALHVHYVYFHSLYGRDILNFGSVRSSGCHNVRLSVSSSSKALNLQSTSNSLSGLSQAYLGSESLKYFVLCFYFVSILQFFEFLDTDNVTPLDSQGVQHLGPVHLPHGLKTDIFHEIVCLCMKIFTVVLFSPAFLAVWTMVSFPSAKVAREETWSYVEMFSLYYCI